MRRERTVGESLKPTFENVTIKFITYTMYNILFDEDYPNFKFDFREEEAIKFIENTLKQYRDQYDDVALKKLLEEKHEKILHTIKNKCRDNTMQPVMVISNYKEFFELLRQLHERVIELFFQATPDSCIGFQVYEMNNYFENIWLRMNPEDFNNSEEFLRKQVGMIKDTTLSEYDSETCLGKLECLDNNILFIKNGIANNWDENSREIQIRIYDKKHYHNDELWVKPHYKLPLIRYGIYEKNGRKVCHIGSIQSERISVLDKEIDSMDEDKKRMNNKMNRVKYKINNNVPIEYKEKVEQKTY